MNKLNSLPENRDKFIMAHLRKDAKNRRATFHQEPTPWFEYAVLATITVALVIIIGEYLFR